MQSYQLHPLCTLFPRLAGTDFAALVSDIQANGLRDPITLHDGMILDGGNRIRACHEAGVEPHFRQFDVALVRRVLVARYAEQPHVHANVIHHNPAKALREGADPEPLRTLPGRDDIGQLGVA